LSVLLFPFLVCSVGNIKEINRKEKVMELMTIEQINMKNNIIFTKIHPKAKMPKKATDGACAYDLYAVEDVVLEPMDVTLVKTGIKGKVPENFEVQVRSRSGLSLKKVFVLNSPGTIDEDYLGEWGVILFNIGKEPFKVEAGMRIAQAKISACVKGVNFVEVAQDEFAKITTARGEGGFNSTGLK
jgi:dUTP pyrophosphatase